MTNLPTATLTLTQTPGLTVTSMPTATASDSGGPLEITRLLPVPNPNPTSFELLLSGPAEETELRLYTSAEVCVVVIKGPACRAGWCSVPMPAEWLARAPNGVFYARAWAKQGGRSSRPSGVAKLIILR